MSYMRGICAKCGDIQTFDVPFCNEEPIEIYRLLKEHDFGECQTGFHVEIGKMIDYYVLDFSKSFDGDEPEFKEMAEAYTPFLGADMNMVKAIPKMNKMIKQAMRANIEIKPEYEYIGVIYKGGFKILFYDVGLKQAIVSDFHKGYVYFYNCYLKEKGA